MWDFYFMTVVLLRCCGRERSQLFIAFVVLKEIVMPQMCYAGVCLGRESLSRSVLHLAHRVAVTADIQLHTAIIIIRRVHCDARERSQLFIAFVVLKEIVMPQMCYAGVFVRECLSRSVLHLAHRVR